MTLWIDAQLSPLIAAWIQEMFQIESRAVRDIGLRDATDMEIFNAAKNATAIIMTKDRDFVTLLERYGAPPQVIWITCGNTSNQRLKEILNRTLPDALNFILSGEPLIEISDL